MRKLVLALTAVVFLFLIQTQARAAESAAMLDFFVIDRFPLNMLQGAVEPVGDDVFSAERKGLAHSLRRLMNGYLTDYTDLYMVRQKDPSFFGDDMNKVFLYFVAPGDPRGYFDNSILSSISNNLYADYIILGLVEDIVLENNGTPSQRASMRVTFLFYDTRNDTFPYVKTYEKSSEDVSGQTDVSKLPLVGGRVPDDIITFATSEPGRVFLSITVSFITELNDTIAANGGLLVPGSEPLPPIEEGHEPMDLMTNEPQPPAGAPDYPGGPHPPATEPVVVNGPGRTSSPLPPEGAGVTGRDCIGRGQAVITSVEGYSTSFRMYPCSGDSYNMMQSSSSIGREEISGDGGISSIATGDIDGDGFDEIVTGSYTPGEFVSIFKVRDGALGSERWDLLSNIIDGDELGVNVATGDFDGDGLAEVAVGTAADGEYLRVFDYDGYRFVTERPIVSIDSIFSRSGGGLIMAAGDFTGDGRDEIAVASAVGLESAVNIYSMPAGRITRPGFIAQLNSVFDDNTGPVSIAAGDFSLSGRDQLVVAAPVPGGVKVLVLAFKRGGFDLANPLANIFIETPEGHGNSVRVAAGDFNGDRQVDLSISTGGENGFHVYQYMRVGFNTMTPYLQPSGMYAGASNPLLVAVGVFE